ncbi:hypothetical protein U1Q18_029446 [Sarracenia purpurea var. burkii]
MIKPRTKEPVTNKEKKRRPEMLAKLAFRENQMSNLNQRRQTMRFEVGNESHRFKLENHENHKSGKPEMRKHKRGSARTRNEGISKFSG